MHSLHGEGTVFVESEHLETGLFQLVHHVPEIEFSPHSAGHVLCELEETRAELGFRHVEFPDDDCAALEVVQDRKRCLAILVEDAATHVLATRADNLGGELNYCLADSNGEVNRDALAGTVRTDRSQCGDGAVRIRREVCTHLEFSLAVHPCSSRRLRARFSNSNANRSTSSM